MQLFVGMPTPGGASGDVIEVVNALNIKRNMIAALNECQVSLRIRDFRQFNDLAVMNTHSGSGPRLRSVADY